MYKVVFLDIDGTIYDGPGNIPISTYEAIRKLKENGTRVVIATGRSYNASLHAADELGIPSLITFNGTHVSDEGEVIFRAPLPADVIRNVERLSDEHGTLIVYHGIGESYRNRFIEDLDQENIHPTILYNPAQVPFTAEPALHETYMIDFFDRKENVERLYRKDFPSFTFHHWDGDVSNFCHPNITKATGIEKYLEHHGLDKSEAVAFGDGMNDYEMLEYVGMGVMMGNGKEKLKDVADMVTDDVSKDGIYKGLDKLGLL